eukprot:1883579-Prymnesium_polylepis.1
MLARQHPDLVRLRERVQAQAALVVRVGAVAARRRRPLLGRQRLEPALRGLLVRLEVAAALAQQLLVAHEHRRRDRLHLQVELLLRQRILPAAREPPRDPRERAEQREHRQHGGGDREEEPGGETLHVEQRVRVRVRQREVRAARRRCDLDLAAAQPCAAHVHLQRDLRVGAKLAEEAAAARARVQAVEPQHVAPDKVEAACVEFDRA